MENYIEILRKNMWAFLSDDEKHAALNEIEKETAASEGREPRKVVFEKIEADGYFDEDKLRLVVNKDIIDQSARVIATVLHEGRHSYQYDVINGKFNNKNRIDWQKNWNAYLEPEVNGNEYFDYCLQPIEYDAETFALKRLKKIANKAGSEEFTKLYKIAKIDFQQEISYAKIEYGRNYQKAIQAKIDKAVSKNKKLATYSEVNKRLIKEGIKKPRPFIDSIHAPTQKEIAENVEVSKSVKEKASASKLSQEQKDLAKKYGVSEKAAVKVFDMLKENKTQEKKKVAATDKQSEPKPKETENKPQTTNDLKIQVSVRSDESKR